MKALTVRPGVHGSLKTLAAIVACGLIAWHAPAAWAIPAFQATATATGKPIDTDEGDAGASASNDVFYPSDGKGAVSSATASSGGLGVFASAGIPGQPAADPFPPVSVSGGASARMRFEDLVFTNPADPETPGMIPVSLRFALSGSFVLSQIAESNSTATGGVTLTYGLGVPGPGSTASPRDIGALRRQLDRGDSLPSNSGIFAVLGNSDDPLIDGIFVTPEFLVPVNTPLVLSVTLTGSASVVTRDGGPVSAITSFGDTLRFPGTGPVFVVPAGYTVDSIEAGIVNNVSAIPLPATVWLFLAGLTTLGLRRGPLAFAVRRAA